jgi:hypothetical protein
VLIQTPTWARVTQVRTTVAQEVCQGSTVGRSGGTGRAVLIGGILAALGFLAGAAAF